MPKEMLRQQILQQLQAEADLQTKAAQLARDEATSEESRAENKYDTHSQEAAYLAEGQAKLAADAQEAIEVYRALALPDLPADAPVALGALVELAARDRSLWYILGPRAGGLELALSDGTPVLLITPQSPLGRQLIGKTSGASVQVPGRDTVSHTIKQVI